MTGEQWRAAGGGSGPLVLDAAGGVPVLRVQPWRAAWPRFWAAFSTRQGGISPPPHHSLNLGRRVGDEPQRVAHNMDRFLASALPPGESPPVYTVRQVHGAHIAQAGRDQVEGSWPTPAGRRLHSLGAADGIVAGRGRFLMILYADCVPLILMVPAAQKVAVVHAGWRGTAAGAAGAAVAVLQGDYGVSPRDIHALIGPAIGPCCYEVDEPVATAIGSRLADPGQAVLPQSGGKYRVDLAAANAQLLAAAGVPQEQILRSGLCTACMPHWFFSHRGEGGSTGRMALVAGWL